MCASLQAQVREASIAANAEPSVVSSAPSVNPVIEWNRTLLVILRTAGAQPPTIHSTLSFAILHASIFDAVNNIDGTFSPYLVRLSNISRRASRPAAADQAAHDVLVASTPRLRQRSTLNFRRTWRRFRKERTRWTASPSDNPLPPDSGVPQHRRSERHSSYFYSRKPAGRLPIHPSQFPNTGLHTMASGHSICHRAR